ncbi:Fusaric acid resistance protein-like-domain-containing protein [Halteromyces radiatus]|uniref:Fusaric acid resistance protein-like-domain-containing protein n=1 Tax=Halteromyces radiatus TaxID=101107 RepID=UPI00221F512A|nr:Fusaric acid resistance protein-like-domain-containing protein [Halteromyces radiatus]KAI8096622.1 Fusaric acid resistance protein-like-domain-containing protein [Halteromyces radiatus]
MSPSGYSEIEVVLDDGTLQRRTVSLSTTFDSRYHDFGDPPPEQHGKHHYQSYHPHLDMDDVQPSRVGMAESDSDDIFASDNDNPSLTLQQQRYNKKYNGIYNDETFFWKTRVSSFLNHLGKWMTLTPQQHAVLKCSFAYFVGSLFTFVPTLNEFIGNNRVSSHLVATATVFFNPAKTLGGMVEATAYGWGYTLFALSVCLGSMVTTDYFIDEKLMLVAHLLSLLFWLAGATFIVSFLKAHWNKPPVATASSLCFIIIFIVVVREGSANRGDFDTTRIQQITSAVATGTLVTITSCIVFWPTSATKKLQNDLETTLNSYKVLLKLLTKTFLLDDDLPEFKANRILQTAIESHRASFTSLQKSLKEAKLERLWNRQIRGCTDEYDQIVKSMQRLSQHVGGLRSSCGIQFDYINSKDQQGSTLRSTGNEPISDDTATDKILSPMMTSDTWSIRPGYRRRQLETEMKRQKSALAASYMTAPFNFDKESFISSHPGTTKNEKTTEGSLINYIQTIRQPLKSLAYTCKRTIFHLQFRFSTQSSYTSRMKNMTPEFYVLKANLIKAIDLFEISQRHAIQRLQQQHHHQQRTGKTNIHHDVQLLASPEEDIFLVYFFVFNMIEFAQELITLVDAVDRLCYARNYNSSWWQCCSRWFSSLKSKIKKKKKKKVNPCFIPNERNRVNTLHTPLPTTRWRRFFIRIWVLFSLFKLQKIRYAIKSTIAAILLATPAFVSSTSNIFRQWRMEWALITLMVVMTPTVGGTNLVAVYRIFSTMLGCFSAMFFYMIFPANMYALAILTWLFSIPNFWLILHHKHGKFGQFTLLAYNLVMLNKYNDRETNNVEVWLLAIQRCVAILVGVIVGLIATAYVWPYEARVELRKGLSDFLLRLSWLYQKLVSLYSSSSSSSSLAYQHTNVVDNNDHKGDESFEKSRLAYGFMELELGLQRTLIDLQALLVQTPNEPRLKGAFPVATYRDILSSCQNIVDKFMSIRTVKLKEVWMVDVQRTFVNPASGENREMVGNVLLYFYLLASALRLKTPLPPYLPPARMAWQVLIQRLRRDTSSFDSMMTIGNNQKEKDQAYMIYFAYVIMMEDIIRELDKVMNPFKYV